MLSDQCLRVLYVDDDRDSFEMLRVMLAMSQIEVDSAGRIDDALALAASERFDLYMLDTDLPDGNGLNLCRTLRAVDPMVPVLFYSGSAHPDEIELGKAAGAAGYITKPNSDKLAETIVKIVTNYKERVGFLEDSRVRGSRSLSIREHRRRIVCNNGK